MNGGTIAVDFDGVIHKYGKGWHNGGIYDEPVEGSENALTRLLLTYAVFVHTSRDARQVSNWIHRRMGFTTTTEEETPIGQFWNRRGLLMVTNRKLPALAYIDDRGIRFTDWDQTLTDLTKFQG